MREIGLYRSFFDLDCLQSLRILAIIFINISIDGICCELIMLGFSFPGIRSTSFVLFCPSLASEKSTKRC